MRLLHTETLAFHDFVGLAIPAYAILSHTWEKAELSYQDLLQPNAAVRAKDGYAKVVAFANKSRELGYDYAWIDTACIDKSSSAELTEAINSMFLWYQRSAVCLIYLADYDRTTLMERRKPRWFTRGWTLQELVASRNLLFYSSDWSEIKVDIALLHDLTSISTHVLQTGMTDDISVGQKMSWAANRETTRVEDIAYCLMGLFGVNMPLLYGEGENAFTRLQEEIIRRSDDETILLWKDEKAHKASYRGIFARHPSEFAHCKHVRRARGLPTNPMPFSLTNTGLQMSLRLFSLEKAPLQEGMIELLEPHDILQQELYVPVLHCSSRREPKYFLSIIVKRIRQSGQRFARVRPDFILELDL